MPPNNSANAALSKHAPGYGKLGLKVNGNDVETGQYFARAEAQNPPALTLPDAKGLYLVVCLDMDPPFPSFSILGPALHWIQSGLRSTSSGLDADGTPFIVDWAAPAPPPGSGPHRYCFFLYEQPPNFDVKAFAPPSGEKVGISKRMRYGLDAFERKARLGPIVASNYFTSS